MYKKLPDVNDVDVILLRSGFLTVVLIAIFESNILVLLGNVISFVNVIVLVAGSAPLNAGNVSLETELIFVSLYEIASASGLYTLIYVKLH